MTNTATHTPEDPYSPQLLQTIQEFAYTHDTNRIKFSSKYFDYDFKLVNDGDALIIKLVSVKAIIRALGHVTKVPIGKTKQYQTYEQAESAIRQQWSLYYKNIRANRSDAERLSEQRRQKAYRQRQAELKAERRERQ